MNNYQVSKSKVCACGKGHGHHIDGICKFCREQKVSRAEAKSVGVRYRGDGISVDQYFKLKGGAYIDYEMYFELSGDFQ
jgi:hypothetical protein